MADRRDVQSAPEIPDLDIPAPRSNRSGPPSSRGASLPIPAPAHAPVTISEGADEFGMEIERGNVSAPPAAGPSQSPGARPIAIDTSGADDFDLEIERGGALVSTPPSVSDRSPASSRARPSGSGLDVTYRRPDASAPVAPAGPSTRDKILGFVVTLVVSLGTAALFMKLLHRPGGRDIIASLPHAFDATSTTQSGAVAIGALVLGIGLGFAGLKLSPRSYAMIGSAAMLLVASLAMVTVTLVATDEHPTPPDGALLIPHVVPIGVFLLGLGIAGRGVPLFVEGGSRRAATLLVAAVGGALLFAAAEVSALRHL